MVTTEWPRDVDGDVLRKLAARRFDFSLEWDIDFQIDVPGQVSNEAVNVLRREYPGARIKTVLDQESTYVELQLRSTLTYDFVMQTQRRISELMKPFGGWCDSWGLLH